MGKIFKRIGPTVIKKREDEPKLHEPQFMYERWQKFMPHLRFSHIPLYKKVSIYKRIELVLEKNIGPHVFVIIGDSLYKCQLWVLRSFSKRLKNNIKQNDYIKIPEEVIDNELFEIIYVWMTSNKVYCPLGRLLDLLNAAKYLKCMNLAEDIFQCLNDHRFFNELMAFRCFLEAKQRGITPLADSMLYRVDKSFLVLVGTEEYLNLDINDLCKLLSSNSLAVQTEIEVFYSALLWLYSDFQKRKQYIGLILNLIRFTIMPPEFLFNWTKNLQDLRPELANHLCHQFYNAMIVQQETFIGSYTSKFYGNLNRNWMRDPKCPYYKHLHRKCYSEVTVEAFLYYLTLIQKSSDDFIDRLEIFGTICNGQIVFTGYDNEKLPLYKSWESNGGNEETNEDKFLDDFVEYKSLKSNYNISQLELSDTDTEIEDLKPPSPKVAEVAAKESVQRAADNEDPWQPNFVNVHENHFLTKVTTKLIENLNNVFKCDSDMDSDSDSDSSKSFIKDDSLESGKEIPEDNDTDSDRETSADSSKYSSDSSDSIPTENIKSKESNIEAK
ncbi:uncharacterized protein LOC108113938 [Drosophila eugracilis]|uniref:uncharacterized protein LOC108113938 n=1 Tax=Drosophila eugracilis TaxID=29029 RepID=UPI0007E66475|nr:uncharacterized protein LOC108113938 [Drosophila eugracilis]